MAKQTTRAGMDVKEKMYLVLVLCFAAVLITVGAAFFIVRGLGSTTRQNDNTADSAATQEPLVADSSYDKNQNTIDTNKYSSTILEESADAGQSYVDETLFLGDSNTARMYRIFNYCSYDNAIGSVGMSGKSLATYACPTTCAHGLLNCRSLSTIYTSPTFFESGKESKSETVPRKTKCFSSSGNLSSGIFPFPSIS